MTTQPATPPGDPLADVPMIFQAGPGGAPVLPVFSPPECAPRFDRTFQIGPDTMRGLGRSMLDIKHELTMRGYFIESCAAGHKSPLIQAPPGIESDQHEAKMRIRFRPPMNPSEEQLLFHELGVISAAHQWAQEHAGPRLVIPDA